MSEHVGPPGPSQSTGELLHGSAELVASTVGSLARWAARAGTRYARDSVQTGRRLARTFPGAAAVEAEVAQLERVALGELRRRLDAVDPLQDTAEARTADQQPDPEPRARAATPVPKQTEPLRVAMAELLSRSLEQTRKRAWEYLYLATVRQLLPDEARILAALADGSVFPLIHVDYRTGVSTTHRLLSNASTVGRAAGVAAVGAVPIYLTRMLQLELVQVGEADPDLTVQYDIGLTDEVVREAEDRARKLGRPKVVRETVAISPFGRELWDACYPRPTPATGQDPSAGQQTPPPAAAAHRSGGPIDAPLPVETAPGPPDAASGAETVVEHELAAVVDQAARDGSGPGLR